MISSVPPLTMPVLTPAIESFLARTDVATPYVVVDLDVVQDPYHRLATALPEATIFYAVKGQSRPRPEWRHPPVELGLRPSATPPG